MKDVAGVLETLTSSIVEWHTAAATEMVAHGYLDERMAVAARLNASIGWTQRWAGSLVERAILLDLGAPLPLAADPSRAWRVPDPAHGAFTTPLSNLVGALASMARFDQDRDGPSTWGDLLGRASLRDLIAWLASAESLPAPIREVMVGRLLAERLMQDGGDPAIVGLISQLAARYVTTPDAAAAFVNSIDPGLLPSLVEVAELGRLDTQSRADFMEPFSAVLAMASHSEELRIDADSLVATDEAGLWFFAGDFDPRFLITALVAAVRRSDEWYGELGETFAGPRGTAFADSRVAILQRLSEHGPSIAPAVVGRLASAGLLPEFVQPAVEYPDGGVAAGRFVTWLAADSATESANLMVELIEAVALHGAADGILMGSAAMVVRHLGSLAPEGTATGIPATALRPALSGLEPAGNVILHMFLRHVMADRTRARVIFAGMTGVLAQALADVIDPADPSSVAEVFADAGRIYDTLGDAYFSHALQRARHADWERVVVQSVVGAALDIGIGAAGAAVLSSRSQVFLTRAMSVADSWGSGVYAEHPTPATEVERVLLETLDVERALVLQGLLLLGGELARAGVIELPSEWMDGSGSAMSLERWDAFVDELETIGFPATSWFNHAYAVGGYFDFDPAKN